MITAFNPVIAAIFGTGITSGYNAIRSGVSSCVINDGYWALSGQDGKSWYNASNGRLMLAHTSDWMTVLSGDDLGDFFPQQNAPAPTIDGSVGGPRPSSHLIGIHTAGNPLPFWSSISYRGPTCYPNLIGPLVYDPAIGSVWHGAGKWDPASNAVYAVFEACRAAIGSPAYNTCGMTSYCTVKRGDGFRSLVVFGTNANPCVLSSGWTYHYFNVDITRSSITLQLLYSAPQANATALPFNSSNTNSVITIGDTVYKLATRTLANGEYNYIGLQYATSNDLTSALSSPSVPFNRTVTNSASYWGDSAAIIAGDDGTIYVARECIDNDANYNPTIGEARVWRYNPGSNTFSEVCDYTLQLFCSGSACNAPNANFLSGNAMLLTANRLYSTSFTACDCSSSQAYINIGDPLLTAMSFSKTRNMVLSARQMNYFKRLRLLRG